MQVLALVTASVVLAAIHAALTPYTQDLYTHRDNTIGIEVNIGTPAQTLLMSVGLSESYLIVASACCIYCCCDKEFAPWQSSTYKLNEYVSSRGNNFDDYELGSDIVASKVSTGVAPQASLQVISRLSGTEWEGHAYDGIVSFAYTGRSQSLIDGVFQNQPPLYTIFYQRQCPAPTVSQVKAGTVTYGAVDTSNCNAFSYEPFDADFSDPQSLPDNADPDNA
ncbi:ASP-6 protein [Aphelenchoides avenae]|nr:ASP-6 protein [Aphelenchus avenae]